eukprot:6192365-Alexandrium_andersonii.AAC.1
MGGHGGLQSNAERRPDTVLVKGAEVYPAIVSQEAGMLRKVEIRLGPELGQGIATPVSYTHLTLPTICSV